MQVQVQPKNLLHTVPPKISLQTPPNQHSRRHPEVKRLRTRRAARRQNERRTLCRRQLHTHGRCGVLRANGASRGIFPGGEWVRAAPRAVEEPEFFGVPDCLGGEIKRPGAAVSHDEVFALEVDCSDDIRPTPPPAELEAEVRNFVLGEAEDGAGSVVGTGREAPLGCAAEDARGHALEVGVTTRRDGADEGECEGDESEFHCGMGKLEGGEGSGNGIDGENAQRTRFIPCLGRHTRRSDGRSLDPWEVCANPKAM